MSNFSLKLDASPPIRKSMEMSNKHFRMTLKELKNATLKNFFQSHRPPMGTEEHPDLPDINVLNKYMPARVSKYPMIQQSRQKMRQTMRGFGAAAGDQ